MNNGGSLELRRLRPQSIRQWLRFGWKTFTESAFVSIVYAAIFCIVGAVAAIWLADSGHLLLFLVLAGGFMLAAPLFVAGYYHVARLLQQGKTPVFDDIIASFRSNPGPFFAIGAFLLIIYLIWLSDAVLLYGVFLHKGGAGSGSDLWTFLLLGTLTGGLLALIVYAATAFSLPDIYHRRSSFGQALTLSVKGVILNYDVMLLWGAVLTLLTMGVLIVALPMIIVLFPVLGYASYAAYLDLIGELPPQS